MTSPRENRTTGVNLPRSHRAYRSITALILAAEAQAAASPDPQVESVYRALAGRLSVLAGRARDRPQFARAGR